MEERLAIELFVLLAKDVGFASPTEARKQAEHWVMGVRPDGPLGKRTQQLMWRCRDLAERAHKGE